MLFKNKFKKPDTDALKNEGSDQLKKAEKDPQGTADKAKDLSKKNPLGKNDAATEGLDDEGVANDDLAAGGVSKGSNAGAGAGAGTGTGANAGTTSSPRVARGSSRRRAPVQEPEEEYGGGGYADDTGYAGEEDAYGAGGYSHNEPGQYEGQARTTASRPQQATRQAPGSRYHHGYGQSTGNTSDLAGAEGGLADPEDQLETPRQHSEYVPGSHYGTPASPRKAPTAAPEGAYDPIEDEDISTAGVPARSPKRTPSSRAPSRNASRKTRSGDEGGVAGGGATSGAGGYGYDHPDYQDRGEWDRRHGKKGFSMPFRRHHRPAPDEEAEQVGGATSIGEDTGVGGAGAGRPSQAPIRTASKGRGTGGAGVPAGGATTGRNSAAVAGADAAVQRAGGAAGGTSQGLGGADASGGAGSGGGLTSKAKDLAGNEKLKGKASEIAGNKQFQGKAGDLAGKAGIPKNVKDIPGVGKAADAAGIPGGAAGAGFAASGVAGSFGNNIKKKFGGRKDTAADKGGGYEGTNGDVAGGSTARGGYGGAYDTGTGGTGTSDSRYGHGIDRGEYGANSTEGGFDYDEIDGEHPAGTHRYHHRGPATATSASKRGTGYGDSIESRAAAHGHGSHGHDEGYLGGYEAGYAAARRGNRPQQGVSSPAQKSASPSGGYPRSAGGLGGAGAVSGGDGYGRNRGYGGGELDPAGGFSRTAGHEDFLGGYNERGPSSGGAGGLGSAGAVSGDNGYGRNKGYGEEELDPAGGFSRTAGYEDFLGGHNGGGSSSGGAGGLRGVGAVSGGNGYGRNRGYGDEELDPAGGFSRTAGKEDTFGDFSEKGAAGSGLGSGGLGGYDRQAEAGGYSKTAGLADDTLVGTADRNAEAGISPDASGVTGAGSGVYRSKSKSKSNPFKENKSEKVEYGGTGAQRYGAHDPHYASEGDRGGGNLGGSEAYGYGKGSSPADEFTDENFGGEGGRSGLGKHGTKSAGYNAGGYGSPGYGTEGSYGNDGYGGGRGGGTRARDQFGRDPAGYQKSSGSAVGPGADEYPEAYDDLRNPGANNLGTRRGGNKGRTVGGIGGGDRGGAAGGLGGLAAGGAAVGSGVPTGSKSSGGNGISGGLSKAASKAGENENVKNSLNKVGGIGKGKAGDLAKSKLGDTKAGEFAGKAKDVPGANDAANKAQSTVGKGIKSKFGGSGKAGGDTPGAAAAVGSDLGGGDVGIGKDAGDAGVAGAIGSAGGAAGGDAPGVEGATGAVDDDSDFSGFSRGQKGIHRDRSLGNRGNDDYESGGYNGGYGGEDVTGNDPRELRRGGSSYRQSNYDDYSYGDHPYDRPSGQGQQPAGVYDRKYGREGGYDRAPSGPSGAYDRSHDYSYDNEVGSGGGANRRLRRGYGEGGEVQQEQLGASNGNKIPSSQEFGDSRGDDFTREASVDSSAYYDSSEVVPGTEDQTPSGPEETTGARPIRKTKQPTLSRPTDARNQDTSIPRLGFQGLFGRKKSASGGSGEETNQAGGSRRGSFARRFSLSKRKSSEQDQPGHALDPETEDGVPVTRTKSSKTKRSVQSSDSARSKRNTEPVSPTSKGSSSAEKRNGVSKSKRSSSAGGNAAGGTSISGESPASPTGQPQTEEGKRFAETFGNLPSLIDPTVPTYGWGTHSEGPPTGPNESSGGGGSGQGGAKPMGTERPKNLPVMRKDPGSSKSTKQHDSRKIDSRDKKGSSSVPGPEGERPLYDESQGIGDEDTNNNYVTSNMPGQARTASTGSYGVDDEVASAGDHGPISGGGDYYNDGNYYNDGGYRPRDKAGFEEGGKPTSLYDDEGDYDMNDASRVPRGGPDEAKQIAQDARGTVSNTGKGEPGIFEKIKNTIIPGSHENAAATT